MRDYFSFNIKVSTKYHVDTVIHRIQSIAMIDWRPCILREFMYSAQLSSVSIPMRFRSIPPNDIRFVSIHLSSDSVHILLHQYLFCIIDLWRKEWTPSLIRMISFHQCFESFRYHLFRRWIPTSQNESSFMKIHWFSEITAIRYESRECSRSASAWSSSGMSKLKL